MIAAIVPAAGRSERMGRPKLLLSIGGEPLIHRLVTALRDGGVMRVIVVAPPAAAPDGPQVAALAEQAGAEVVVPVSRPPEMRDSLELGLERLSQNSPPDRVMVTPADTPGITRELVARLLDAAASHPGGVVIPCFGGRRGHPIVLPWTLAAEIRELPSGAGLNALVARHGHRVFELAIDDAGAVSDLDTPDDLARWGAARRDIDRPGERFRREALDPAPRGMGTMQVRVRLFAAARERVGRPELELELPAECTVADLRTALRNRLPELGPIWTGALIAVNEEYAGEDAAIAPGSQVAVIPPVSGGGIDSQARSRGAKPYQGDSQR
jgi:molybdenum cofactor cytidylyltransferase